MGIKTRCTGNEKKEKERERRRGKRKEKRKSLTSEVSVAESRIGKTFLTPGI